MVVRENGIFSKAKEAKEKTNIANIKEQIQMEIANKQALNEGNITDGELKKILEEYGTINYEGETIKGITTKEGNYEIAINEIYNGKTTQEVKKLATQAITVQNYGDEVNYSANGVDSWKVFLNDGKNVYIIASDFVPNSKFDKIEGISNGIGDYCVKGDNRDILVKWLQNKDMYWIKYAEGIEGATATGGPTLEQFWLSYNEKYKTNYLENQDLSNDIGYDNILYFPHKENLNSCYGYWLATAYLNESSGVCRVSFDGTIAASTKSDPNVSVRPLICLPSNIYANKTEGKWVFTK